MRLFTCSFYDIDMEMITSSKINQRFTNSLFLETGPQSINYTFPTSSTFLIHLLLLLLRKLNEASLRRWPHANHSTNLRSCASGDRVIGPSIGIVASAPCRCRDEKRRLAVDDDDRGRSYGHFAGRRGRGRIDVCPAGVDPVLLAIAIGDVPRYLAYYHLDPDLVRATSYKRMNACRIWWRNLIECYLRDDDDDECLCVRSRLRLRRRSLSLKWTYLFLSITAACHVCFIFIYMFNNRTSKTSYQGNGKENLTCSVSIRLDSHISALLSLPSASENIT